MSAEISKKMWELKEEAKWAPNVEKQMEAIRELGTLGTAAIPPLEEILSISVRNEVRQSCIDAIKSISQKNDNNTMAAASTDEKSKGQPSADDDKKNEKEKNVIEIKEEPLGEKKTRP